MARGLSVRMKFEPLRSLAFGSIGAAYAALGAVMANPVRFLALTNTTDVSILFSFDGVNDHLVLPSMGFLVLDITANRSQDTGFYLSEGDRAYVKQASGAAGSGSVYLSVMYGV